MIEVATPRYAPYYCEENVFWLAQEPRFAALRREVVFVSNASRTVAMLGQRAARSPGEPVVWDYHVVLAVRGPDVVLHDLDCVLGPELPALEWLARSFPAGVQARFAPRFRVVDADRFVAIFSSDRAHMRAEDGGWRAPPPEWPTISNGPSNLMRFVDTSDPFEGALLDLDAIRERWR